jgi:hypothetical protein
MLFLRSKAVFPLMLLTEMNKYLFLGIFCVSGFFAFGEFFKSNIRPISKKDGILFTENKGQIVDQNYKSRSDILFYGKTNDFSFFLKNNCLSYQLRKVTSWKKNKTFSYLENSLSNEPQLPDVVEICRIDNSLLNSNPQPLIVKDESNNALDNFYTNSSKDGMMFVKSYYGITYKNIYRNIDLHYYSHNGNLKYDFIVKPNSNFKEIQIQVNGSGNIDIQKDGSVLIETAIGNIIEAAPIVFQNGKILNSKWKLSGNTLSFEIIGYSENDVMIIDPSVRVWGTYFGGEFDDIITATYTDANKNLYVCGYTNSSGFIATSGAFQFNFGSPPYSYNKDAFLAKFDSSGTRIWGTYYGDSDPQTGDGLFGDLQGNIYLSGAALGTGTMMATPGAFQTTAGGGYLSKFSSSGVRIWATQYNGTNIKCITDKSNNVYIFGKTGSTSGIATSNGHQTSAAGWTDCFIAKFDPNGNRIWGTYYGGASTDNPGSCAIDTNNNLYICGTSQTSSGTAIATSNSYQNINGGSYDAFLAKFDSLGTRQWGTYYGGVGFDWGNSCEVDSNGNVYLIGTASNSTVFPTSNCHQSSFGGGSYDAFIVKFSGSGLRIWSTFYGGDGDDEGIDCSVFKSNIIFCGTTTSTNTAIPSPGGFLSTPGGGPYDCFLAEFDLNGVRVHGTYYGGNGYDKGTSCNFDASGNYYLAGFTTSTNNISTPGCHQDTAMQYFNGYMVKFKDCGAANTPTNTTSPLNQNICSNNSSTLTVMGSGYINWFPSYNSSLSLGSGTSFITPTLSAGTYSYFAEASSCTINPVRAIIVISVSPLPQINIAGNDTVCSGDLNILIASGANSYTWNNFASTGNSLVVNPTTTTTYTCFATNINGCSSSSTFYVYVDNCTGIDDLNKLIKDVLAFPNPFYNQISLKSSQNKLQSLKIFTVEGQEIITVDLQNRKNAEICLNTLSPGLYFFEINLENNYTQRFHVIKL